MHLRSRKTICSIFILPIVLCVFASIYLSTSAVSKLHQIRDGDISIAIDRIEFFDVSNRIFVRDPDILLQFKQAIASHIHYRDVSCPYSYSWSGVIYFSRFESVSFSISLCTNNDSMTLTYPYSFYETERHYGVTMSSPQSQSVKRFLGALRMRKGDGMAQTLRFDATPLPLVE